jgi:hypothetical protein
MATACLIECAECGDELHGQTVELGGNAYCPACADTLTVCVDCGDVLKSDNATTSDDGNAYCESCYREHYAACDNCGNEIASDDVCHSNGGDSYCESCYNERYTTCERCGDEITNDDAFVSDGGDSYCDSCYSELYTHCDSCDSEVSRDDAIYRHYGSYCEECAPSEGEWEAEYFCPSPCFGEIGSNRRFGVELETSSCPCHEEIQEETVFGCKEDGSISGMEFVSPILSSDRGLEAIRQFCRAARGFSVDNRCGYHLHIDATRLTVDELKRVAVAYYFTERLWQSFVPHSRRDNTFCKPLEWTHRDICALETIQDFHDFAGSAGRCGDRYHWLNLQAIRHHGTIEIRLHTSTLDAEKVCNWVKAHLRFVEWAVNCTSLTEIWQTLGGSVRSQFGKLCQIWADDELAQFYADRAEQWGTCLTVPQGELQAA